MSVKNLLPIDTQEQQCRIALLQSLKQMVDKAVELIQMVIDQEEE